MKTKNILYAIAGYVGLTVIMYGTKSIAQVEGKGEVRRRGIGGQTSGY